MTDTARPFRSLSLGAGQGSTALAIACADGLKVNGFDFATVRPDIVSFADTGGELLATYQHLAKLIPYLTDRGLSVGIVRKNGTRDLRETVLARARDEIKSGAPAVPFHLAPTGKANQSCTYDFKSVPLDRATKKASKLANSTSVEILIGFTVEEWKRIRGPRKTWPDNWSFRYPMIEAGVNRGWCQEVCRAALGYVPQSSACAFCPHRPDVGPGGRAWIKENEPETWAQVVEFDHAIRVNYMGLRQRAYVSRLLLPVEQAVHAASAQGEFWVDGSNGCDSGECFT